MEKSEQLALFDLLPEAMPAGLPPSPISPPSASSRLDSGSGQHKSTSIVITPPPSLPPGAKWREIQTPLQPIGFTLVRSRRRSIGLQITDDGLRVTAPQWVGVRQIDEAVQSKAPWILEKLGHYQTRKERLAMAQTQWCHGGQIPYLGQRIVLSLGETSGASCQFQGDALAPRHGERLAVGLPVTAEHTRIRDSVDIWLQVQATTLFSQRFERFRQRFGLGPSAWRLSAATTRWGSCNSAGRIMLNWRLIHFELPVIDYVMAHELAHLTFMNHSRDFWREVERLCPDFQQARNLLRGHNPSSLPLL